MLKYSLGLDISSKDFHCCLSSIDFSQRVTVKASHRFSNSQKGFELLTSWLAKHFKTADIPLVVCMEATGVYYENCALFLSKKGFKVSVILPNKAKKYLQATGLKSKNDKIDAQGLARMGAEQSLEKWVPMSEFYYTLRSITRHYQSIQELKTVLKNQLHAHSNGMYPSKVVDKALKKMIKDIEKQAKELKLKIEVMVKANQELKQKVENINAIKGLGILTIAVIIAETNGFELFNNSRQLVSFCGYDIVENQSGKHNGKTKISKKGNSHIRRALFMPAFSVVKHKVGPFKALFDRTFQRHHTKMKSYVAVQRKLLVLIYSLWKNGEKFEEKKLDAVHTIAEQAMMAS